LSAAFILAEGGLRSPGQSGGRPVRCRRSSVTAPSARTHPDSMLDPGLILLRELLVRLLLGGRGGGGGLGRRRRG
jgi:hypothetical protein